MPKLKPATQVARREHILDAAEQCFAREGFHRTTMQHICKEAAISAGALYVYFASKEALIEGIVERDRQKLAEQFTNLANAPDLMQAMLQLGEHYFVEEPQFKRVLHVEIGAESTRNPEVGAAFRSTDKYCVGMFEQVFERAKADGRISPSMDIKTIASVLSVIGDGMFWRRAVDPGFDAKAVLPIVAGILGGMLNPVVAPSNIEAPPTKAEKVSS